MPDVGSRTPGVGRPRHRAPAVARQSVQSAFYLLAGARIVGMVLQAGALTLLARWAGPADFGLVAGILGMAQVSMAVADLGISPSIVRARAADPADRRVPRLLALNGRTSVLLGLAWSVGLAALWLATGSTDYLMLLPAAFWIASEKTTETLLVVCLADGRTGETLRSVAFRRSVVLALFVVLHLAGLHPVLAYACALAGSAVGGVAYVRRRVHVPAREGPVGTGPLLLSALPFWINSVAVQARSLDVLVVRAVSTGAVAGIYAAPSRLTTPLRLLPTSIAQVVLPYAVKGDRETVRLLLRTAAKITVGMFVIFGALAILAEPLLRLTLGPPFVDAADPLRLILLGLCFAGVSSSLVSLLQARHDEWFVAAAAIAVTTATLLGVAAAAHRFGAAGAAGALSASYVVHTLVLLARLGLGTRSRVAGGPTPVGTTAGPSRDPR